MEKLFYLVANQCKRLREEEKGFFASNKREREGGATVHCTVARERKSDFSSQITLFI
jgi:hypothetical protein